ncbi:hypothetical protein [Methylobacterium sp. A54F]
MTATIAQQLEAAASAARRQVRAFPGAISQDELPWRVIAAFDADIRGFVERDRRIEDERDRVLITAVTYAETPRDGDPDAVAAARTRLLDAIDYLEQAVLRFGIVNRAAAKGGHGQAGTPVAAKPPANDIA